MTEESTIKFLNSKGLNLVKAKNQFSYFDASDDSYLVEIKNRKKYYSDKLIESMKLYSNFQQSVIQGKKLLYVVTDEKGVWIFNISDYIDVIIKTPPKVLNLPKTTEFGNTDKIPKYCYTLPESIAKHFKFS
jgi:hypothetical protein|tara:strand:- start:22 stop:417 length:396 start_codon:yes stop_codon:yes gene_type:complete